MSQDAGWKKKQERQVSPWSRLTWDHIDQWSDPRSIKRGKRYERQGRVRDLARTKSGHLLAWVQGTQRYAVRVELSGDGEDLELDSECTCPVGLQCKHAVAATVAYLAALGAGKAVPTVGDDDARLTALSPTRASDKQALDDEDGMYESEGVYEIEAADFEPVRDMPDSLPRAGRQPGKSSLADYLGGKTREQLVELVLTLSAEHAAVRKELAERALLEGGNDQQLLKAARAELRKVTSEEAWWNHWDRTGHLPNYQPLQRQFQRLLAAGRANDLLPLGVELLERGKQQVEQGQDEGETATGIRSCLDVIFEALAACGLSGGEKLLFAVYATLLDENELCSGSEDLLAQTWPAADWGLVADALLAWLAAHPPREDREYRRQRIASMASTALESAGRQAKLLQFLEEEARRTGTYEPLVRRLLIDGQLDAAERAIRAGLQRTPAQLQGVRNTLRERMAEILTLRKDRAALASHHAEAFFEYPTVESFRKLLASAKRINQEAAVRAGALAFLETGERPSGTATPKRHRASAGSTTAWPLAGADYFHLVAPAKPNERAFRRQDLPRPDLLLEIAMCEQRNADALAIYDLHFAPKQARLNGIHFETGNHRRSKLADFVSDSHPARAAEFYEQIALELVESTGDQAYQTAVGYLKKLRSLLARIGHEERWPALLAGIRDKQRRKRNLLALLDRLDPKPIASRLQR